LYLSLLDFGFPGTATRLATTADRLGYRRYWIGEHHSSYQCANPLLLGALLSGTTRGIRMGTGGVCLTYRTPFQIAEDARLVEFMFPGSFDLGVTRGLMNDKEVVEALLDGRPPESLRSHHEKLLELHGLVTGRLPSDHPLAQRSPYLESGPPLWVLGLGEESARLAGQHGMGFCFSLHHAPARVEGRAVIDAYRRSFQPSPEFPEPAALVVVSGICARSDAEAAALKRSYLDRRGQFPPGYEPQLSQKERGILGTPEAAAEKIHEIAHRFEVGEVMVLDLLTDKHDERMEMYELLAQACGLSPRPEEGEEP
jgi:luciferase family oxidoreductase group 1